MSLLKYVLSFRWANAVSELTGGSAPLRSWRQPE
jgi:hypothetical protein